MAVKEPQRRVSALDSISVEMGKVPPQAVELEEAVLGAVMLEKDAILAVLDILVPESFYREAHRKIYAAIVDLSSNEKPIDILTVKDELKKRGQLEEVGGAYYISQLTSRIVSAAHVEFHARIIAQKFIQRELIRISNEILSRSFDESVDVDDLLDFSEQELFQIAEGYIKRETSKINVLVHKAIEQMQEAAKRKDNLSGVPSGFTKLDRLTSGWQRSDLVIIAARPSMGKTAFALSMARNITIEHERPVAVFSLEMSSLQLVNRLIVSETELGVHKIRNGHLNDDEWKHLESKIKSLIDAPLFIDDTPAISLFEFRAKCRRLKMQYGVEVIIVDYLQLMTAPNDARGNREQEVSTISRTLKAVAKELDVPIIALSQLNRSVELRSGSKRPQLSDLRESGAIEQDADMVIFIHRAEKYGITEDSEGNSTKGLAEIILAKHRNGPIGDVILRFKDDLAKFSEPEDDFLALEENAAFTTMTLNSRMNNDFEAPASGKDQIPF
ncbi:MAG: replicative DNA helicase [Chlorobi bacterium]|nr:replicative DNA helicase [Chlorobiota bacterium]